MTIESTMNNKQTSYLTGGSSTGMNAGTTPQSSIEISGVIMSGNSVIFLEN